MRRLPQWAHSQLAAWLSAGAALSICILYAYIYSISFPLTDDWALVVNAMLVERGDWANLIWHVNGHPTIVPFLVYLPLAELSHYDARCEIGVTILCFALQLLLFQRAANARGIELAPPALLIFGLSHWMEYQWGVLMVLAMGQTAALWSLFWYNRFLSNGRPWPLALFLLLASVAIASYAAGPIAIVAAILLTLMRPNSLRLKLIAIALLVVLFVILYGVLPKPLYNFELLRSATYLLTALGALILGSTTAIFNFGWSALVVVGILWAVLAIGALLTLGWARRADENVALFVSIVFLGLASLAAAAFGRPYLGNWHVQLGLPVAYGIYGLWLCSFRQQSHSIVRATGVAACALLLCTTLVADYLAFAERGPAFRAYIGGIERYALNYATAKNSPPPYPAPVPRWNLNQEILDFLKSKGHPLFAGQPPKT